MCSSCLFPVFSNWFSQKTAPALIPHWSTLCSLLSCESCRTVVFKHVFMGLCVCVNSRAGQQAHSRSSSLPRGSRCPAWPSTTPARPWCPTRPWEPPSPTISRLQAGGEFSQTGLCVFMCLKTASGHSLTKMCWVFIMSELIFFFFSQGSAWKPVRWRRPAGLWSRPSRRVPKPQLRGRSLKSPTGQEVKGSTRREQSQVFCHTFGLFSHVWKP